MLEKKIMMARMDPEVVSREIQEGILKDVVDSCGAGAVIGLSGGIDSTTVAFLAQRVFQDYNAQFAYGSAAKHSGKNELKLYGLIMPSISNAHADQEDAEKVANILGIEYKVVPIQPLINAFAEQMPDALHRDNQYDRGNLASEIRAVLLSREGAYRRAIMLNTGNKDEDHGIGYCTKRGDNLGDLAPNANLPKRLVRELATWINVPEDNVKRKPSAGLWPGQTDEGELGYVTAHKGIRKFRNLGTYDYIEIVTNGLDQGFSAEGVQKATGFGRDVVEGIKYRHEVVAPHKNQVAPPSIPVTLHYEPLDFERYENG